MNVIARVVDEAAPLQDRANGISLPNLRHVRLFERVAECGSLSKAAAEIHISQPAATQAVARLERQFGVALFHRAPGGLSLTEPGEIVLNRLRRALTALRDGSEAVARQSRLAKGLTVDLIETHATMAHIRALSAFAESGSFAGAGRLLGQAESSVQRAARQLERIGAVPLFEGYNRGVRLTAAGRSLAAHANLFLQEIVSAHDELEEFQGRFQGRIRIGMSGMECGAIVPRAITELSGRFPHAKFEIHQGDYDSQSADLIAGRIDLIAGVLRSSPLLEDLAHHELSRDPLAVLARHDHPLTRMAHISATDLLDHPWVLTGETTPTRAVFNRLVSMKSGSRAEFGAVVSDCFAATVQLVAQSDRLALFMPRQIGFATMPAEVAVLPLPVPLAGASIPVGVTLRAGSQPTRLSQGFLDCLRRAAAAEGI